MKSILFSRIEDRAEVRMFVAKSMFDAKLTLFYSVNGHTLDGCVFVKFDFELY